MFIALWSPSIIAELNRVLTWKWLERTAQPASTRIAAFAYGLSGANWSRCSAAAAAMMEILESTFEVVAPRPPYPEAWEGLTGPWDVPIWAAAVDGGAHFVVSDNKRDHPSRQEDGRHIYRGVEYLKRLGFPQSLVGVVVEQGAGEIDDGDEALVEHKAILAGEGHGAGRCEGAPRADDPKYGGVYRTSIC